MPKMMHAHEKERKKNRERERKRCIPNYRAICPFLEAGQHRRQLETHGENEEGKMKGKRNR